MSASWPLWGLSLRTPQLYLRVSTDQDLDELADLAVDGVHDPSVQPFRDAWTDKPPQELARSIHQWEWSRRGAWKVEDWICSFVVRRMDTGEIVGVQSVGARDFAVLREVRTGSWVGLRHQGRGFGTQMRTAVLDLAFTGLGASLARTCANEDNKASLAITRKLGYERNGSLRVRIRDTAVQELHYTVGAQAWSRHPLSGRTKICGLEPCLEWFGAAG